MAPTAWALWKEYGQLLIELRKPRQAREALIKARAAAPEAAHAELDALLERLRGQ